MLDALKEFLIDSGRSIGSTWLMVLVVFALIYGVFRGFFRVRRIQSKRFELRIFLHEVVFSALTLSASGLIIGLLSGPLRRGGHISFADGPAPWYGMGLDFALYFVTFDLYFYAVHRIMHLDPFYTLIHKTHHRSTAPNALTAFSFNPVEGALAGAFMPLFLAAFEIHRASLGLIFPFQILMSIQVHSGFEIFPKWWYRTWFTKWFLTAMFHDQHHQYFHCNFGGFTTLWDRLFGTMNPAFEADFDRHKAKLAQLRAQPKPSGAWTPLGATSQRP